MVTSNKWVKWTLAEDRLLKKFVADGKTVAEIAKILGRTKRSVGGRKSKFGFPHQKGIGLDGKRGRSFEKISC